MSAYELQDVIKMWSVGKLTIEQAIGQILQLNKQTRSLPETGFAPTM